MFRQISPAFCKIFLSPAPIAIRANRLKITREDLLAKWAGKFTASASTHTPDGIIFAKREPLFALPEFKEGLFEMQDEIDTAAICSHR